MRPKSVPFLSIALTLIACADQSTTPGEPRAPQSPAAASKPPVPISVDVTATLYDTDGNGTPLLTRSDDHSGQGFATYTAINKISTRVVSDGGWHMYLGNQSARTVYLVLASQGIPVPDGYYSSNVEVYAGCFEQNGAHSNLFALAAGTSRDDCTFGLDFSFGRTKYKLAMGPASAGTGRAAITCNTAANGSCTSWTILPNPNAANAGVANLYHFSNNGGLVLDGVYHNSFHVEIAK